MSALCQKRLSKHEKLVGDYEFLIDRKLFSSTSTYRLRAIANLGRYLAIAASDAVERLGGLEIDDQLKFGLAVRRKFARCQPQLSSTGFAQVFVHPRTLAAGFKTTTPVVDSRGMAKFCPSSQRSSHLIDELIRRYLGSGTFLRMRSDS